MKIVKKSLDGPLFPILLLVILGLTWGMQLSKFGFYLDDWVSLSAYEQGGISALKQYAINDSRPFMYYFLAAAFKICGTSRIKWQLVTLSQRFWAALFSWLLIRVIWPKRWDIAAFSSIIFMIFPFFKHQALSITYHQIWLQYAMVSGSFLLTALAMEAKNPWKKWLCWAFSWIIYAVQLIPTEYYLTVEFSRFILIWIILTHRQIPVKKRIVKSIEIYLPYMLLLLIYLYYRFVILPSQMNDRNVIEVFDSTKGAKGVILYLIEMLFQYTVMAVIGVWFKSLNPSYFDLTIPNTLYAAGMGILMTAAIYFLFRTASRKKEISDGESDSKEIFILGIIAAFLGFWPGIMINVSPAQELTYHDRFLIPSFWGISLALASGAALCLSGKRKKILFLSVLVGISVFFQIQNSAGYRYAWKTEQQFQWQMKWRVPDLKEKTAVLGNAIIAAYMGGWADTGMLIEMYGKNDGISPTPYIYVYSEGDSKYSELSSGQPIYEKSKIFEYNEPSENVLVVTKPEYGKCLWVLEEWDAKNPYLEPYMKQLIPYQNKDRIILDSDLKLNPDIFGKDYPHDWCYYYEKASLAIDQKNYQLAASLYEPAAALNSYHSPVEMTPFIQGAAFSGDWDDAVKWTEEANKGQPHMTWEYFSNLWSLIERDTQNSPERAAALEKIKVITAPVKNPEG